MIFDSNDSVIIVAILNSNDSDYIIFDDQMTLYIYIQISMCIYQ